MQKSVSKTLFLLLLVFTCSVVSAQITNDECEGAISITDVNACSANGEYTLSGATASGFGSSTCANSVNGDIWFSFVAEFTAITVTVRGATNNAPGGTLRSPSITLYAGDCSGTINQLECKEDRDGANAVELRSQGLFVGRRYILRIDSRTAAGLGSFQLCMANFNPPADAGQDCIQGALLCDKSSFTVESVSSNGLDPFELEDITCISGPSNEAIEQRSTWFTWVAETNGTLEFTLTPLSEGDDLDFYLFELPSGITNCSDKRQVRCMATGAFEGQPGEEICNGPTGLRAGSTDGQEFSGCDSGDDNFVAPLDMVAGMTYALAVNNFTVSESGFTIEFGGSGTFRGPEPDFVMTPSGSDACLGSQITFNDASSYADGNIVNWAWTFGVDSDLETATGEGPHIVNYNSPGIKQIVLTVETDQGCIITDIQDVLIDPCCQTQNAITQTASITPSNCWDTNEGSISFAVSSNLGSHDILWDNGSTSTVRDQLLPGNYMVTVSNAYCDTLFNYNVGSPDPITTDTIFGVPNCRVSDGSITLLPSGGTSGYQYQWENSPIYVDNNSLTDIPQGNYTVVIRDAVGCDDTLSIQLNELQLELLNEEQSTTMPTCFGFSNGQIVLDATNGSAPYEYDFGIGNGFEMQNSRNDLPAGIYDVTIRDANLCEGNFSFELTDHSVLDLMLDKDDISCNGEIDGNIQATVLGGFGNYSYSWSNGSSNPVIEDLSAGFYSLEVRDENDCLVSDQLEIIEPAPIGLTVDNVVNVICNGDETGEILVQPIGGSGNFRYSLDEINYQDATLFQNLGAGDYTIYIQDVNECVNTNMATITEPAPIIVDGGVDQEINFGFETTISTTFSPASRIVTYSWLPPEGLDCEDCASVRAMPFVSTDYIVQITDQDNCIDTDTVRIVVNDFRPVYIPNVFTPNDDGSNDRLNVFSNIAGVNVDLLQIYDRWGSLVYESENLPLNDTSVGWDGRMKGTPLNAGVYVYFAKVRFLDNAVREYKGDVTLLR